MKQHSRMRRATKQKCIDALKLAFSTLEEGRQQERAQIAEGLWTYDERLVYLSVLQALEFNEHVRNSKSP